MTTTIDSTTATTHAADEVKRALITNEGSPPEPVIDQKSGTFGTIKRLLSYMMDEGGKPRFAGATLMRLIAVAALVLMPYIVGRAVNEMSEPGGSTDDLGRFCLYGVVLALVFVSFSYVADRTFARLATRALRNLQRHLFSNMQKLSMGFFYRTPVGQLLSLFNNDAEAVAVFYEQAVSQLTAALITIVMLLGIMLLIDVTLTLVALAIVPLLLIAMYVVTRVASPAFAKMQEDMGTASGFQEETLAGHKVIISKRRQTWAEAVNEANAADVFHVSSKAFFASLMQFPLTMIFTYTQIVLVFVVGALRVADGETNVGTVLAFAGYVGLMASPLSRISNLVSNALNATAGGNRLFKIVDEVPDIEDAPDAVDYEFKGGHIEFRNVDFGYVPGRLILKNNSFEVQPGESIGICGPTGAGKSTIINILTRYYDISSGTILIDGQDLSKLTRRSLREQVGAVLQEAFLFTDTVMNNLKFANRDATEEDCIEAAKKANAHEFILGLPQGYDTLLAERGASLSQGQRQMITIARAMVADPKIMILDEATSNVDTRTEKLIQDGLRNLMEGKTSFSIAHRLSTIRDSSRIMVVNGGEIAEMASHDDLMAQKGFYYALYMSQFKGARPDGADAGTVDFAST